MCEYIRRQKGFNKLVKFKPNANCYIIDILFASG